MLDRRIFLKRSGLALVAGAFAPRVLVRMAEGASTGGQRTIVVVFQRGAVDGLNMVVPCAERLYAAARPTIAVRPPGREGGAIDLDGFFGLHPALSSLARLFADRSLAFVHAAGSPDSTRSHFDAQDFLESGTPGRRATPDGFLSRALEGRKPTSPLRAVSLGPALPRMLSGSCGAVAMSDVARFGARGEKNEAFEAMYAGAAGPLSATAKETFEAARILRAASPEKTGIENGAEYPPGPFGSALRQIAQLIRARVGLEVACADVGGWDTHAGEGGAQGQLANRLREFGGAIAAFARDLGSRMSDVTLVTCSEFGRTVRENGNRGTDHGHANVMTLLGGGVTGGKVHGRWPGLDERHLFEGRDLEVTTDYRDVFSEVLRNRLGVTDLARIFPGWKPSAGMGLVAG